MQCCASIKICSREGICTNRNDYSNLCSYRKLLKRGINYFKGKDAYLEIQDRLFHIGKRRSYNNDTQALSQSERDSMKELFGQRNIPLLEDMTLEKCVEEIVSDQDRAICRIVLTIGEDKYNIHNFNGRAITEKTAAEIRRVFMEMSFAAAIEYVGKKSVPGIIPERPEEIDKKINEKIVKPKMEEIDEVIPNQISMDDFLKGLMEA